MSAGHWIAIGLFLSGLATQIQGLHHWSEVQSPAFVSGALLNLGGVIVSMFTRQIGRNPQAAERRGEHNEKEPT